MKEDKIKISNKDFQALYEISDEKEVKEIEEITDKDVEINDEYVSIDKQIEEADQKMSEDFDGN